MDGCLSGNIYIRSLSECIVIVFIYKGRYYFKIVYKNYPSQNEDV